MFFRDVAAMAMAGMMLASSANGHMVMSQPVPYGVGTLNNSPLYADYPCKQRPGVYDVTTMNNMQVGVPQTLAFNGTALHGGGTCQVSVSLDKNPTAQSVFKVIHTIEGGCPGIDWGFPKTFLFKLPAGFPNGEFALAWTWLNKIGNREMYMNCAPITVAGGSNNLDVFKALPDMQLANIPGTTCTTVDNTDPIMPQPGNSVERISTGPFQRMVGNCGYDTKPAHTTGQKPTPAPSPQPVSPVAGGLPSTNPPNPAGAPARAEPSTSAGIPANTHPPDSSTGFATSYVATSSEAPTAPARGPSIALLPNSTSPGINTTSTCAKDGAFLCNGPARFGICAHGKVLWQPVAAGTQCKDAKIIWAKLPHRRNVAGRASFNLTTE